MTSWFPYVVRRKRDATLQIFAYMRSTKGAACHVADSDRDLYILGTLFRYLSFQRPCHARGRTSGGTCGRAVRRVPKMIMPAGRVRLGGTHLGTCWKHSKFRYRKRRLRHRSLCGVSGCSNDDWGARTKNRRGLEEKRDGGHDRHGTNSGCRRSHLEAGETNPIPTTVRTPGIKRQAAVAPKHRVKSSSADSDGIHLMGIPVN